VPRIREKLKENQSLIIEIIDLIGMCLSTPGLTDGPVIYDMSGLGQGFFFNRFRECLRMLPGYGLDDRGSIPSGGWEDFPRHRVQTGSRTHLVPYPMGTGDSFPEGKTAGA
jgi:hypothetical protein